MEMFRELGLAVEEGDTGTTAELVGKSLKEGSSAPDILNKVLIPAMKNVGEAFDEGDIFLPGVLMAAQAMKAAMTIINPLLIEEGADKRGTVVIGTVQGDQHDIGKNLVAILLEGAGFNVVDLGCDVSKERFVASAKEHNAQLIGMSALLNNTMVQMKGVITALEAEGLKDKVKVMVGGAPLDEEFAREIGADAYAADGITAVQTARSLLGD